MFDKIHQVLQRFGFYESRLVLNLFNTYSTSLYGSTLWQLKAEEHLKLTKSWKTAIKILWDLPYPTHNRFLEALSPVPHLDSTLCARYIGFVESLSKCSKPLIRLLFDSLRHDISSQTGENVKYLLDKYSKA